MSPGNQRQAIVVVERLRDVLAKRVAGTTGRDSPTAAIVGVRPEQIAHGSLVGNLLDPVESTNVVECVDAGRQTSMQTKDLVVDKRCKRQVVEQVGKVLPNIGVAVFAKALVVEAVHLCDLARLVVSTEDGDTLRVTDLERDKKSDRLYRVVTSVYIVACCAKSLVSNVVVCAWEHSNQTNVGQASRVAGPYGDRQLSEFDSSGKPAARKHTHEQIVCVGVWSTNLEKLHEVVELPMYVTADCDRAFLHGERKSLPPYANARSCIHQEGVGDKDQENIQLAGRWTHPARLRAPVGWVQMKRVSHHLFVRFIFCHGRGISVHMSAREVVAIPGAC